MVDYARLSELEKVVFSEIDKAKRDPNLWNGIPSFHDTSIRIGKSMYPIHELNLDILRYVEGNNGPRFLLEIERVPRIFRYSLEIIIPPERVNSWLLDEQIGIGKSGQELISELNISQLYENLELIGGEISKILDGMIIPYLPCFNDIIYAVRLGQHEQLNLQKTH